MLSVWKTLSITWNNRGLQFFPLSPSQWHPELTDCSRELHLQILKAAKDWRPLKSFYLCFLLVPLFQKKSGKRVVGKLSRKLLFPDISEIIPTFWRQLLPYTPRSLCGHRADKSTSSSSLGLAALVLYMENIHRTQGITLSSRESGRDIPNQPNCLHKARNSRTAIAINDLTWRLECGLLNRAWFYSTSPTHG